MVCSVLLTKAAAKSVADLPAIVQARVADKIVELRLFPNVRGVKALKGSASKGNIEPGWGRIAFFSP
ncbi:MAG: hypothetical protein NVS3B20_04320 [Polyangiales bacterium]